jgi:hypothetical protein
MTNYVLKTSAITINLSPVLFRNSARDYFKCYLDFEKTGKFSAVPFFLCCRAIELAIKAMHLERKSQKEIKQLYSHNLVKSYSELDRDQKMLIPEEFELLKAASEIYREKQFEYLNVFDAATAYSRFPDLEKLAGIAEKITGFNAQQ